MNAFQVERLDSQGLKPAFFLAHNGTAEAVPFPKPIYEIRSKESVNKYWNAAKDIAERWLCADKSVRATLEMCR